MALNKQVIDIPFTGGLNQIKSARSLTSPELLVLRNGRYLRDGAIDKTLGYEKIGQLGGDALATWRGELLRYSDNTVSSYISASNEWVSKGSVGFGETQVQPVAGSPADALTADVIEQDNVQVVMWQADGTAYYSVIDAATGANIVSQRTILASSTCFPRLVRMSGYIHILYNDTINLKTIQIPTANPTSATTITLSSVLESATGYGTFDAVANDAYIFVIYKNTTTTTLHVAQYTNAGASVASTDLSVNGSTPAIHVASATKLILGYTYITSYLRDMSIVGLSPGTAFDVVVTPVTRFALGSDYCYVEISGPEIYQYSYTSGTFASLGLFTKDASIASRVNTDGQMVIVYTNGISELQRTYFIARSTRALDAKLCDSEAGGILYRPSNFYSSTLQGYICAVLRNGRIQSENATLFAASIPQIASFNGTQSAINYQVGNNQLFAGGILKSYDGVSVTEYGFNTYPETGAPTESNTTPGAIPNGTYILYAIYEWTDAQGTRFQSAPSPPKTITTTGNNDTITWLVRNTFMSSRTTEYSRYPISVRGFMTTASGTVPYYATSNTPSSPTSQTVTLTFTTAPSSLTSNEILYTSGGALENLAPPSHTYSFVHDNRIVCVGLEDRDKIALSKDIKPLTGAGFHPDLTLRVDSLGGDIVAGASLNGQMIIFKETAIYSIAGSGPNDLGANSTLQPPSLIALDVGCRDARSVCQTPDGVFFMSQKGIYLLTKGLTLTFIGAPVIDHLSETIVSSNILLDAQEIRFVTNANVTLVYNYNFGRWSETDTFGAVDAITWGSAYVYITSGKVLRETSTSYLNDGSWVATRIRTGWLRLNAMQGYQRVYRMGLLGTYYTNNAFRVKIYQNYSDTIVEEVGVAASALVNTSAYGGGAVYGSDAYYGGSNQDEVFQFRYHLAHQKCESISFEITDGPTGSNNGQGFRLDGIALQIAGKGGMFRNSSTRSL